MNTTAIKVTVLRPDVITKTGSFKDDSGNDREYTTRKQLGKIESDGFVYPFDVRLEEAQQPYAVGDYELDVAAMLEVNKGVAKLGKFTKLTSVAKPVARAQA